MRFNNRFTQHGQDKIKNITKVKHDFEELFNPSALEWHEKTIHDADQAFEGILKAEGYIH